MKIIKYIFITIFQLTNMCIYKYKKSRELEDVASYIHAWTWCDFAITFSTFVILLRGACYY